MSEPDQDIRNIFSSIDGDHDGLVTAREIHDCLQAQGLLCDDPRFARLASTPATAGAKLDLAAFLQMTDGCFSLVERAVKGRLVIPKFRDFASDLRAMYEDCRANTHGRVADYIPQLSRIDPELFAVAVATVDGQRAAFGDVDTPYCVQSTCKPVNYAMALELNGEEKVHGHVGREPSGRGFNELALNANGLPHNPMVNAGSIMSCSMIHPRLSQADRFDHVMRIWTAMAGGRPPGFDNAVYLSEKATADRNFALSYYMQEKGAFPPGTNLLETLDFYFQTCSISVTAPQMAIIAATFANAGVCPLTNERVFSNDTVRHCLSLMYSCGMYDFSGEFAFTIGLPAKSGVSGAMIVIVPGIMGAAIWSPRLDSHGNSVRGVEFCRKMVERFTFHNYDSFTGAGAKIDPTKPDAGHRSDQTYQLIHAASLGDLADLSRLIAHGANINDADYDGRTPLHLAAAEGRAEAVDYLLMRGASPKALDRWGATPADDAKRHGHGAVEKRLRAASAADAATNEFSN